MQTNETVQGTLLENLVQYKCFAVKVDAGVKVHKFTNVIFIAAVSHRRIRDSDGCIFTTGPLGGALPSIDYFS